MSDSDVLHIVSKINITARVLDLEQSNRQTIKVDYALVKGSLSPNDWFGLYNINESNNRHYLSYSLHGSHIHPGESLSENSSLSFSFPAPRKPGTYIVKYFPSLCGYTDVYRSDPLDIQNRDSLSVEKVFSSENQNRIKSFNVTWNISSVDISSSDYIALYELNAQNNSYIEYKYIDANSGTLTFSAPVKIGIYQFRYHSSLSSKYVDIVRSVSLEIKNTDIMEVRVDSGEKGNIVVTWDIVSQPKSSWDWIGIFEYGASNNSYMCSSYVNMTKNEVSLPKSNLKPGLSYEARYFSNKLGKYTDFRKTEPFHI